MTTIEALSSEGLAFVALGKILHYTAFANDNVILLNTGKELLDEVRHAIYAEPREPSNMERMRFALEKISLMSSSIYQSTELRNAEAIAIRIEETIKAVLAKPPRNCDIFTTEEDAIDAYEKDPTASYSPMDAIAWMLHADSSKGRTIRRIDMTKDEAEEMFRAEFGRPWTTDEDELAAWLFKRFSC